MRRRRADIFQRFFRTEAIGGLVLVSFAALGLALANSPWADIYNRIWATRFAFGLGDHALTLSLRDWINDGLMAIFFLLVGLEIKRELIAGELASVQKAVLPLAAAFGGMAVPALIYFCFNPRGPAAQGWGIPMATDIAFALGALALLAPGAPTGAKVFLAALAIADDMGAVLVIAIFYVGTIHVDALVTAGALTLLLAILNKTKVVKLWPYLLTGLALWYFVHHSGVHATIAGVALAMMIPSRTCIDAAEFSREAHGLLERFDRKETGDLLVLTSKGQQQSLFALNRASQAVTAPILRLEHSLHRFSAFFVMPLFALANAGVKIGLPAAHHNVTLGVLAGLIVGKPLGITAASWLAVKFGAARLPAGTGWAALHGASWLAGIGFTMSLFITVLAFQDAALIEAAKLAIVGASILAALVAAVVFRWCGREAEGAPPSQ